MRIKKGIWRNRNLTIFYFKKMCVHSKYFIIVLFNKTQYCIISFYHFQSVYTRVYVLISFTKLGPWLGFIGNMQIVYCCEHFSTWFHDACMYAFSLHVYEEWSYFFIGSAYVQFYKLRAISFQGICSNLLSCQLRARVPIISHPLK